MYIDKQTTAKWLVNCAIRNIFAGECAISNHVVVKAARDVLHEYARVKQITLDGDLVKLAKVEYAGRIAKLFKEHYNFFKHSDQDPDDEIDITNIQFFNEAETFLNIHKYHQLYGTNSQHMACFMVYMIARKPQFWDFGKMALPSSISDKLPGLIADAATQTRQELCQMFFQLCRLTPGVVEELKEVQSISFSPEAYISGPKRDLEKGPYFKRKKTKE